MIAYDIGGPEADVSRHLSEARVAAGLERMRPPRSRNYDSTARPPYVVESRHSANPVVA